MCILYTYISSSLENDYSMNKFYISSLKSQNGAVAYSLISQNGTVDFESDKQLSYFGKSTTIFIYKQKTVPINFSDVIISIR
jgi:hypothetical protein